MPGVRLAPLALTSFSVAAQAADEGSGGGTLPPGVPPLKLEYAFTVRATLSPPIVIGNGPEGLRRFVPITGGTFTGPLLSGKVVPGSGDWQVVRADGALNVEARYTLEAPDGTLISVNNRGIRHAPPEIMAKLTAGEKVPPDSYYFRTSALFEAPLGSQHEWMNRALFVSRAEREPNAAIIHFYRIL
jgi:hypothetical protein